MATDMQGNVVLLALDEVKQGSMPEDQKKAMVQGITQNNAQIVFEALMSNLRKEAKIKIGDARPFPFPNIAICLLFSLPLR